jgi:integrase
MGKGMKDRVVDLVPSLVLSLEAYLKGKAHEESVFGLKASTISGMIRWAAKKAGVNIHCHSLRHFFGETLLDTGTDPETLRRLMGHSNLSSTQRYLGRTDQQRRDAIDRMEKPPSIPEDIKGLTKEKLEREVYKLRLEQTHL